ncbi:STAS domain-containing protein [Rubrobacter taiwanensis]|uniref:STAS domain-containing protein n=1 Tax=Rubrobacter taiwanensis TaxID=185139 RepID=UPI0024371853|nr:STAS domain-containing protein [Rubrobacter taiwanensis]
MPESPPVGVVVAGGELEAERSGELEANLERAANLSGSRPRVVLDLSRATFMDVEVLHALRGAGRALEGASGALAVVAGEGSWARRLIRLSGYGDEFHLFASFEEATAWLTGRSLSGG